MFRLSWFSRFLAPSPEPLTGAPHIRRQKTYSAESGYVYQHTYEGRRRTLPPLKGEEHVFRITSDRKTFRALTIQLPDALLEEWEREQSRDLLPKERHGLAKIMLFALLDQAPSPAELQDVTIANRHALDHAAAALGFVRNGAESEEA